MQPPRHKIKFGTKSVPLPVSRVGRIALGVALVIGGLLGFLPILGFWMIPLGLLVLSFDLPSVRRWRRLLVVRIGGFLIPRFPRLAGWLGFDQHGSGRKTINS